MYAADCVWNSILKGSYQQANQRDTHTSDYGASIQRPKKLCCQCHK